MRRQHLLPKKRKRQSKDCNISGKKYGRYGLRLVAPFFGKFYEFPKKGIDRTAAERKLSLEARKRDLRYFI